MIEDFKRGFLKGLDDTFPGWKVLDFIMVIPFVIVALATVGLGFYLLVQAYVTSVWFGLGVTVIAWVAISLIYFEERN